MNYFENMKNQEYIFPASAILMAKKKASESSAALVFDYQHCVLKVLNVTIWPEKEREE